jgi:threonine dehydratase
MSVESINRNRILAIREAIQPYIRKTPVLAVPGAAFRLPCASVHFKLEQLQPTGSFKVRGAFANLLTREIPPVGVVAASGGNHGAAVAYAAMKLRKPAKIFIPKVASPTKIDLIRSYGADLVVDGERIADAFAAAEAWAVQSGTLRVPPFDQVETVLGQGTLAAEFEEQAPELDTILVPIGGGGLIGGIAA